MELKLIRKTFTNDSTIGELFIDGVFFAFTLEDKVRESKIKNVTAIDAGKYEVVLSFSNRFKKILPLLLNVKNFEGIRIHAGNYSKDTEGCILVGSSQGVDFIGNSKITFGKLLTIIEQKKRFEKVFITIEGAPKKKAVEETKGIISEN